METKLFLKELSNKQGISGFEYNLHETIVKRFKKYADEVTVDKLGNIIALKKGEKTSNNPKVMIAAHMDEIGLMVKDIEDNGFIRFTNIGGIDPRTILGQEVIVHGKNDYFGVIASKPPHLQDSKSQDKAIKMDEMIIDIGYLKEDINGVIQIGDPISINRKVLELKNNRICGKSLDNRAGLASLLDCMKQLVNMKHEVDVYFVATVQEEVSMAGALTSTYMINPDIGIAVDVGFGMTPELDRSDAIELGGGPGITLGGNIHPGLRKKLIEIAKDYNIPNQMEVSPGPTGTDARVIQITRDGIPTLLLSIPLRYMHTSVEVVDMNDIYNTGKLLAFFINSISWDKLEGLLCF